MCELGTAVHKKSSYILGYLVLGRSAVEALSTCCTGLFEENCPDIWTEIGHLMLRYCFKGPLYRLERGTEASIRVRNSPRIHDFACLRVHLRFGNGKFAGTC